MSYTIIQYQAMARRFNQMTFRTKIKTVMKNRDLFILVIDTLLWDIKVKNETIQKQLEESGIRFEIETNWSINEMMDLVSLLGIDLTDI